MKKKVIEWCTHHRDDPTTQDDQERRNTDIEEWDQKYMEVDQETLFDIILVIIINEKPPYHDMKLTLIITFSNLGC
jgi:hypothetical protein